MRNLFLLFALLALAFTVQAQSPKGMNFQGYARDMTGLALGNRNVSVRFTIYDFDNPTPADYEEVHNLRTDPYGVFNAVIGSRMANSFSKISFGTKKYWLKVEVSPDGTTWSEISNAELLSVPYAKTAENGNPAGTILAFGASKDRIPTGYLPCDGSTRKISDFPALFAIIGHTWGAAPAGEFRLPDLRGQFLRGVADDAPSNVDPDRNSRTAMYNGTSTGNKVGSYQWHAFESHTHGMSLAGNHSHTVTKDPDVIEWWWWNNGQNTVPYSTPAGFVANAARGTNDAMNLGNVNSNYNTVAAGDHTHTIFNTGGSENRPINAAVWYMIKF